MNLVKNVSNRLLTFKYVYPLLSVFTYLVLITGAAAQTIGTDKPQQDSIGKVSTLNQLFYWVINFMKYVGWAGVLVGVFIVLALLIYKLIGGDDQETMKKVRDGITKAIIIVVIGVLLLSGSFIIKQVASLIGADSYINPDLENGNWN